MMKRPDSICVIPWSGIEASPLGTLHPCCLAVDEIARPDGQPYHLGSSTLSEAFASEYMQNLRREFRSGGRPATCRRCWAEEQAGRTSKRQIEAFRLRELGVEPDFDNDDPRDLVHLDLKLGNICNLKCRICGPWASSKWAQEEIDLSSSGNQNRPKTSLRAYQQLQDGAWPRTAQAFWSDLESLLPTARFLEFTGGEPFLIKEHFEVLRAGVERGCSKRIRIHYNSNGTVFPDAALELWKQYGLVQVAFSIDDVGARFEYQRHGAIWREVEENVDRLLAARAEVPNLAVEVCTTVNIQNVLYLEELCRWVAARSFDGHFFNLLHDAPEMSITSLPGPAKERVSSTLLGSQFTPTQRAEVERVVAFMNNAPPGDGARFREVIARSDGYRNERFAELHREMAELMALT